MDERGGRITEPELLKRIRSLVIPPAWKEVWICSDDNGHIQATGFDEAGRKQYLYHDRWTERQAGKKFGSMEAFARSLPRIRAAVNRDIEDPEASKECACACAVRLIELTSFRLGSEQYADENETYGVATVLRSQVSRSGTDGLRFEFPAKGSLMRVTLVEDRQLRAATDPMLRRRSGPGDFLVYNAGGAWRDLRSEMVNEYLRENSNESVTAKDFRTWNGTVEAAVFLSKAGMPASKRGRERAIRETVKAVAELLGNTPSVARDSYIDPRILDRYRDGETIPPSRRSRPRKGLSVAERRVLDLIT
jgi:DNA topoisomerase IB